MRAWGPLLSLSLSFAPHTLSHPFSLSLSRRRKEREEEEEEEEEGEEEKEEGEDQEEEIIFFLLSFKLGASLELGIEVSECVGEDGSSIRRASAKLSPKRALEGVCWPEESRRRPRIATSSLVATRHYQKVGGAIPKQLNCSLCLSPSSSTPGEDRGKGIAP
uniref:Secreted protein n=1 Tax=Ananas comosus var. bracteatus TaxID=296719 RepID=A0A6V7PGP7_ANACO|nr:unnamed protein product [Ananas comosus var. bracteatus]